MNLHKQHTDSLTQHQGEFLSTRNSMLRESLLLALIVFFLVFGFYYITVGKAFSKSKDDIRERLKHYAELSASLVDGDVHTSFTSAEKQSSASYNNALKPLKRVLDYNPDIAYIYTLILKDNKVYFILDPTPEDAKAQTGIAAKSNIMDEYTNPTAAMMQAFSQQKTTVDLKPYDDAWGHFISAFSPVYNANHQMVGLLGVDMNADEFALLLKPNDEAHLRLILHSTLVALLAALGIIALRYASFYACRWLQRTFLE